MEEDGGTVRADEISYVHPCKKISTNYIDPTVFICILCVVIGFVFVCYKKCRRRVNMSVKEELGDANVSELDSGLGDTNIVSSTPSQRVVTALEFGQTTNTEGTMASGGETSTTTITDRDFFMQVLNQINQTLAENTHRSNQTFESTQQLRSEMAEITQKSDRTFENTQQLKQALIENTQQLAENINRLEAKLDESVLSVNQTISKVEAKLTNELQEVKGNVEVAFEQISSVSDRVMKVEDSVIKVETQSQILKDELKEIIKDVELKCHSNLNEHKRINNSNTNILNEKVETVGRSVDEVKSCTLDEVSELKFEIAQIEEGIDSKAVIDTCIATVCAEEVETCIATVCTEEFDTCIATVSVEETEGCILTVSEHKTNVYVSEVVQVTENMPKDTIAGCSSSDTEVVVTQNNIQVVQTNVEPFKDFAHLSALLCFFTLMSVFQMMLPGWFQTCLVYCLVKCFSKHLICVDSVDQIDDRIKRKYQVTN